MKRLFILILALIALAVVARAQVLHGEVSGKDKHGNEILLPGANVLWLGTYMGTNTDTSGHFHMDRPASENLSLVVSFLGYKTDTIGIGKHQSHVEIVLVPDELSLNAVEINERKSANYISKYSPINTQILTDKELVKAACCNLSESFEGSATVDVNYTDAVSGAKQIELLGLAGVYSQIQVENIPLVRGMASSFGLGYIPGPWMESIQVSKGTSTVKNGFESVSGQINVEFKKPEKSERLYVNLFTNDVGRVELNFNTRYRLNKKWSTMVLGHGEYFQNKFDHNSDGFMDAPLVNQYNLINRWKYQGSKGLESVLGIKMLQEERAGGQMDYVKSKDYLTKNAYGFGINTTRFEAFAKLGYVFPARQSNSFGFINSYTYHDQNSFYGQNRYLGTQQSYYGNFMYQGVIKTTDHKYVAGASFIYDKYNENYRDSLMEYVESVPGIFSEYTYSYKETFNFIAGLRYDYQDQIGGFFTPRVHLRYKSGEHTIIRASAGKGYRFPRVYAENSFLLATSKQLVFDAGLAPEEAWNYGLFISRDFEYKKFTSALNLDFYRTDFVNQTIVDFDIHPNEVHIYNLKGKSYSNSFQAEYTMKPVKRLDITLAYRFNDVKTTFEGNLQSKPLAKIHKGLFTASYNTKQEKWQFDFTLQYHGKSRLPDTSLMHSHAQSPDYFIVNAQVIKRFKKWEIYLGGENLTGFTQHDPILAADDPFGSKFDATRIWGPIMGRKIYTGIRFVIK